MSGHRDVALEALRSYGVAPQRVRLAHRRLRQQGVCVPGLLANADGQLATLVTDDQAGYTR